jgi:hypothetical protein
VEEEEMVRNFMLISSWCPKCTRLKLASILAQKEIDFIYLTDPREKSFSRMLGEPAKITPWGIVDGFYINSGRDINYMYILFKEEGGD